MLEVPFHPDFTDQMERTNAHGDTPCIVCGRKCSRQKGGCYKVFVNSGFTHLLTSEERKSDPGEMGWFPIGPTCLKRHPEIEPYKVLFPGTRSKENNMALSPFQQRVLEAMKQNELSNHYEGETAPFRPKDGMHSGYITIGQRSVNVPYRTISGLLKGGYIKEDRRYVGRAQQGDNSWESSTIYYYIATKTS